MNQKNDNSDSSNIKDEQTGGAEARGEENSDLEGVEPLKRFQYRVNALFESSKALRQATEKLLDGFNSSSLGISKFLTAFYAASFLFTMSSSESLSKMTGGNGPILWSSLIFLTCLICEAFRFAKLASIQKTGIVSRDLINDLMNPMTEMNKHEAKDYILFLDQLIERFSTAALEEKLPFKFEYFQSKFKSSSTRERDPSELEYLSGVKDVIHIAEQSKERILEGIDTFGKYFGNNVKGIFTRLIFALLTFCLYMTGAAILFATSLFQNFSVMFRYLISIFEIVASYFAT